MLFSVHVYSIACQPHFSIGRGHAGVLNTICLVFWIKNVYLQMQNPEAFINKGFKKAS